MTNDDPALRPAVTEPEVNWSLRARIARMLCHCDPDAVVTVQVPRRAEERTLPARHLMVEVSQRPAWELYLAKADEIIRMVDEDRRDRAARLTELQRLNKETDQ